MIDSTKPLPEAPCGFALSSLSSIAVFPCTPWAFKQTPPENVRKDKGARDAWINNPATRWEVYSLVEGIAGNRRIKHASNTTPECDSNPPHRIHGFVADYDAPVTDFDWRRAIESFSFKPQYVERTLSGNLRLLWPFEHPLLVPGSKFLQFFLENALEEHFRADKLLPAFDRGAWVESNRYYTNSGDWTTVDGALPIPGAIVRGWAVDISSRFSWVKESGAVEIPLDALRPALEAKYPRFSEWDGGFELGAMGPSFWIEDSTSPKSAIVRETGMQTFAAHATQNFYSWRDLLGTAFVKSYQADNLGRAAEDIYHDGKYYWRKLPSGAWRSFSKEDTIQHLRVSRGVSPKRDRQGISDLDRVILYVQEQQNVIGAGPFVLRSSGVIEVNGDRVLNVSARRVLKPSEEDTPWGPNGKMAFLSKFIGFTSEAEWAPGFLPSREATDHLLSWAHRYYKSGFDQQPASGQTLFIAGPVGVGKTFFNALLGKLMGGSVDAQSFLLDNDNFNSDLFGYAHWMVDDGVMTSALSPMRMFAEKMKKMAANRSFRANEKFRVATMVTWQGRLVVTLNVDEESIRAIPDLGGSILDKVMLFRTSDKAAVEFHEQAEMVNILAAEAPYFARKLLDFKIPEYCRDKARFGVKPYWDPSLLRAAEHSSSTGGFLEILESWKESYFKDSPEVFWEGTAFQLHNLLAGPDWAGQLRRHDSAWVGRQLAALKSKGHRIDCANGKTRRWKIYRDDGQNETVPAAPETPPNEKLGSQFAKPVQNV